MASYQDTDEQFEFVFDNNTANTPSCSVSSIGHLHGSITNLTQSLITNPASYGLTGPTVTATSSTILATGMNTNSGWYSTPTSAGGTLQVSGGANIKGELTVKGVNLSERLDIIEQKLGILRPNSDLEGRWETLKSLGEEYRKLEKEILEKEKIWDILKK